MSEKTERTVTLLNKGTGKYEEVPASKVSEAIASKRFASTGAVDTQSAGGGKFQVAPEDLAGNLAAGDQVDAGAAGERQQDVLKAKRKEVLENSVAKGLTFAEGLTDAFSMGLLDAKDLMSPGTRKLYEENSMAGFDGEGAEARRKQHSGYHTGGEVVGTIASLAIPGGAVGKVAEGGTKAGQLIARGVLGEQKVAAVLRARKAQQALKAGATGVEGVVAARDVAASSRLAGMGVRVAEEAGAGAALSGAMAFNHQLNDAIHGDTQFAGESILGEIGMGTLLGGGVGVVAGGAGALLKRASRKEVLAQSGLLDAASPMSQGLHADIRSGIAGFEEVLATHETRLGILQVLAEDGHLPKRFMQDRADVIKAARKAKVKLEGLDMDAALTGTDNAAYLKWRDAMEEYQHHIVKLDDVMSPKFMERAQIGQRGANSAEAGAAPRRPEGPQVRTEIGAEANGDMSLWAPDDVPVAMRIDNEMAKGSRMADYERLHGKPWETMEETLMRGEVDQLGGRIESTPKVGQNTGVGSGRGRANTPVNAEPVAQEVEQFGANLPANRFENYKSGSLLSDEQALTAREAAPAAEALGNYGERFGKARAANAPHPIGPLETRTPREFPGGFDTTEWAEEFASTKAEKLNRRPAKIQGEWLNNNYGKRDLAKLPDGYFMPAKDAAANAEAFNRFRELSVERPSISGLLDRESTRFPSRPAPAPARPVEAEVAGQKTGVGKGKASKPAEIAEPAKPAEMPDNRPDVKGGMKSGKDATTRFLEDWHNSSMQMGPKVTPADKAAARLGHVMDQIKLATGGKLDSAAGAAAMAEIGVRPAATTLGSQIDQIIAARQLGMAAADASRGIKPKNGLLKWLGRRAGGKILASAVGGGMAGPIGYALGYAWSDSLFGFAGKAAGAAGRATQSAAKAVDRLLGGGRSAQLTAVVSNANRSAPTPIEPVYSDRGYIKDPVQRILEVQRVASNPEAIRKQVAKQFGGAADLHPEITASAAKLAQERLVGLAIRAPAVYFDKMGNTVGPASQAMRRWLELENAMHNPEGILESIGLGTATEAEIDGLRTFHPGVHQKIITETLSDPERLKALSRTQLKKVEAVIGMPLQGSTEPGFVARQMMAWQAHGDAKMNQQKAMNAPAPTPAQSGSVAPGNQ